MFHAYYTTMKIKYKFKIFKIHQLKQNVSWDTERNTVIENSHGNISYDENSVNQK